MSLQDRSRVRPEPVVVRYAGELDAARTDSAEELERTVGEGATEVVVDLIDVTFIDSSFIRALVLAHQQAVEAGGWLRVAYTHHVIGRVIDICGLTDVLPQYPTVDAAVRGATVRSDDHREPR